MLLLTLLSPDTRPKVFRVPDDSDMEDSCSECTGTLDSNVHNSINILRSAKILPAAFPTSSQSIDLTMDEHYPLSNVRGDENHAATAVPGAFNIDADPVSSTAKMDSFAAELAPASSNFPMYNLLDGDWPSSPVTSSSDEDIDLNQSTDMETDSSDDGQDVQDQDMQGPNIPDDGVRDQDEEPHNRILENFAQRYMGDIDSVLDEEDFEEHDFEEHDNFEEDQDDEGKNLSLILKPSNTDLLLYVEDVLENSLIEQTLDGLTDTLVAAGDRAAGMIPKPAREAPETRDVTSNVSTLEHLRPPAARAYGSNVGKVGYVLNPNTSPLWHGDQQAGRTTTLRLPPITEAMNLEARSQSSPQRPDLRGVAELGERTGKFEYFVARAQNKVNAMPAIVNLYEALEDQPERQPFSDQLQSNDQSHNKGEGGSVNACKKNVPTSKPVRERTSIFDSLSAGDATLPSSDWMASATEFLNSAAAETEEPTIDPVHILDETSAYQFELSKKAAQAAVPVEEAAKTTELTELTGLGEAAGPGEAAEPREAAEPTGAREETVPQCVPQPETPVEANEAADNAEPTKAPEDSIGSDLTQRSSKRKADEISQTKPEEQTKFAQPRPLGCGRVTRRKFDLVKAMEVMDSAPTTPPPTKRLRRVAEVVGYAALGGVAVMSALIATAPTL